MDIWDFIYCEADCLPLLSFSIKLLICVGLYFCFSRDLAFLNFCPPSDKNDSRRLEPFNFKPREIFVIQFTPFSFSEESELSPRVVSPHESGASVDFNLLLFVVESP